MATLKTCFKCNKTLPLDSFYKHPNMGDGHLNKCKSCARKDVRENYVSKIGEKREYERIRNQSEARKQKARESFRASALAHPDRQKAAKIVSNHVRDGKLPKQPCLICGEKAEAHHPDYSRPLDVVWLCRPHHRQAHAITKRMDTDLGAMT